MTRLLLDENISPKVADGLRSLGHDAVHVNDVGLRARADPVIMLWAAQQGRTVVTHDHDYLDNLWTMRAGAPSVIKVVQRGREGIVGAGDQVAHLGRAINLLDHRLKTGALVVMDRSGLRMSPLPLARRFELKHARWASRDRASAEGPRARER